jgi:hypothetical protein
MALIAVAADKGAPGVTTTATALAAVWPRPVVLAECDPAGGDIVYRLPGAHGGRLDPRRGLLSLAVAARHGLGPAQVWEHAQQLRGGLDVLAGVTNAEQGSGLEPLWGPVGDLLATLPQADVIADCGRLGPDGPYYELLAQAAIVILVIRPSLGEVLRLRDRVAAVALAVGRRGGRRAQIGVLVLADRRRFRRALAEVSHAVGGANSPVGLVGGIAYEPKSAQRLRGEWGGRLDRSLLIRTARDVAAQLAGEWLPPDLPASNGAAGAGPVGARPVGARPVAARWAGGVPAGRRGPGSAAGTHDTRVWVPGAREPAARGSGWPAAVAPAGRPGADRGGPPWPDPAWPDPVGQALPRPGPAFEPLPGPLAGAELAAAELTAAQLAASQLTTAELTAAQVAATRLAAAQALAAQSAPVPGNPVQASPAQPDRAWRSARRPSNGRGTGRGGGRGRHAGGPAQPTASPEAAEPSAGRARTRGW